MVQPGLEQTETFLQVEFTINRGCNQLSNERPELVEFDDEVYFVPAGIRVHEDALLELP